MSLDLLFYALRGDAAEISRLLDEGADPNLAASLRWSLVLSATRNQEHPLKSWQRVQQLPSFWEPNPKFARTRTPLLLAAEFGHYDAVVVLLDRGAYPNVADENGVTPLWATAKRAHVRCAEALLRAGANPNQADAQGETPLLRAARQGSLAMVERLLAAGAEVNAADQTNATPLICAAARGENLSMFSETVPCRLLSDEAERDEQILQNDVFARLESLSEESSEDLWEHSPPPPGEYPSIVRILLEQGADVHAARTSDNEFEGGETALHYAALSGCVESTRRLLAAGAVVDAQARMDGTPLACAMLGGSPEVIQLLLDAGADVNASNEDGMPPLMYAVWEKDASLVRLLLEHGADIRAHRVEDGEEVLHLAAKRGRTKVVEVLLEYGASVDVRDGSGITPLMMASYDGKGEVVRILIAAGADVNARDAKGRTPLDWAQRVTMTQKILEKQPDLLKDTRAEIARRMPVEELGSAASDPATAEKIRNRIQEQMESTLVQAAERMQSYFQRGADRENQARSAVVELLRAAGAESGTATERSGTTDES